MSCGGATQVQLVALTAVDSYLTAAATSTFFAYRSMPYAVFGLEFAELQLTGAQTLNEKSTTQGTCTIDRRGDKLAKIYLQFKADAIMNITQAAISLYGGADSVVVSGGDQGFNRKKYRGIVGGLDDPCWVRVRLDGEDVAATASTDIATATGVATLDTDYSAYILPGDRATFSQGFTSIVQSVTGVSVTLETAPAGNITGDGFVYFEREINRGFTVCGANPLVPEDFDALVFSKTAIDGPRADTGQSALGFRYRGVGGDPRDLAAYYRPFAPCLLIDTVTLLCGSQCLDTLTASALVIYHELFVPKHAQGIRNLNATRDIAQLKRWALQPQVWRMLLPFNMCTSYAKALSLVSICLHNLKLNVKFNPVMVAVGNGVGGIFLDTMSINAVADGTATAAKVVTCAAAASESSISPWLATSFTTATSDPLATLSAATFKGANIGCTVLVEYVYTGKAEREMEVNLTDRMVVVEHQTMQNIVLSTTSSVTTQITVNHPIASIFCTAVSSAHTLHGDKHNYDGFPDPLAYHRHHPRASLVPLLKTMQLKFNSAERTPAYDTTFYREILNVNALKNTPDTDICAIHFGIASAYDPQQSGSANLARLERVDMVTTLNGFYTKDNSILGGLNAPGTTVGAGQMTAAHQVTLTFDFLSINVWEVKDCMMGRMYA